MSLRNAWSYPHGDPSIALFDRALAADWPMDLPTGARVLELGCCETDFHAWLLRADPSIRLTGVDVNECPGYSGAFVQGAAEAQTFAPASFEAVILLGSLEHFGLGFYGDPAQPNADRIVLAQIAAWLVPGGWCYYDVPWTPTPGGFHVTENRHFRVYDDDAVSARLTSTLTPVCRGYAHGQTVAPQPTRPDAPASPFWYMQRLLRRSA